MAIHFLDDSTYRWGLPEAVELHLVLSRAYPSKSRAEHIVAISGVDRTLINFDQPAQGFWRETLTLAGDTGRARALVHKASTDPAISAHRPVLERFLGPAPASIEAPIRAAEPLAWRGNEVITGKQETFLDVSFLQQGLHVASSVVRIGAQDRTGGSYHGTGFLIAPDLLLTNHHVLHDPHGHRADRVEIWFNYEREASGRPRDVDPYEGDPGTIDGDPEYDWAVIRPRKALGASYPFLSLRPSKPVSKGDFVFIVQHPEGRPKKIGLLHNDVVDVTEKHVQYRTDTLPGSSGAPVMNDFWQVVALHHRGFDGSTTEERRNQGIRIERVVEGLRRRGYDLPS